MDGIRVCVGGVALRGHGGVSDVVEIKLFPLPTNLPLEYLSLCISCVCVCVCVSSKEIKTLIYTSLAMVAKCLVN